MKLREIKVKNFRNLVDVIFPIDDTIVLVGENNSGKTALLDALRIALPRSVATRGNPFDEYDYHMFKAEDSPQTSEGIIIELWFREDNPDEWTDSLIQSLLEIVQTDPAKDLDYIGLRVSSKYDKISKEMSTRWEFLALDGQPLGGSGAKPANLNKFFSYIRLFYLSALRDSNEEFSPRSQYWGRILRDLKISEEQRKVLSEELTKLNDTLLKADSRLEQVRTSLNKIQRIISVSTRQNTSIQALPLKPWDLMSRSEVVIKTQGNELDFPLSRYGQGMQSLAVLFLFEAYVDMLLASMFQPETKAILTLEEPEAHLHPQAIRALAANLGEVKSQKIISTHSPFFIQEIPFTRIRMFRRQGPSSKVLYLKRSFSTTVKSDQHLLTFCKNNASKYSYDEGRSTVRLYGKMEKKEYRDLLTIYPAKKEIHAELKRLYIESQLYLSDDDLSDLDTYAKRIRGEVLFARAWLLCEGQCEYMLLKYFAELMKKPFDQAGVTVIDFKNNGSPSSFVALSETFEIPWLMICDNDDEGKKDMKKVKSLLFGNQEINQLIRPLPLENADLEIFLVKNGFLNEYVQILKESKVELTSTSGDSEFEDEVITKLKADKTHYIIKLIEKLRSTHIEQTRVPEFFIKAINDVITKAG